MAEHKPYESGDDKDYIKGWTIQKGAAPAAPETVPGNVVTPEQLPYKAALDKAGVDGTQYFANVSIAQDDEAKAILRGEKSKADEKPADEKPADEKPADEKPAGEKPKA